jgi:hypothetical protein
MEKAKRKESHFKANDQINYKICIDFPHLVKNLFCSKDLVSRMLQGHIILI